MTLTRVTAFSAFALCFALTACHGGGIPNGGVPQGSDASAGSRRMAQTASSTQSSPNAAATSSPLSIGGKGSSSTPEVEFADNPQLKITQRISMTQLTAAVQRNAFGPIRLTSVKALTWSQTSVALSGIKVASIGAGRQVYEVKAALGSDYSYRGNRWNSGTRTAIIDAATGLVLCTVIRGNMTYNEHASDVEHAASHAQPLNLRKSLTSEI